MKKKEQNKRVQRTRHKVSGPLTRDVRIGDMTTKRFILFLAICLLAYTVCATEFYEAEHGLPPNHLEPIGPQTSQYDRRLAENLCVTDGRFGQMVVRPSFGPEQCFSVHAQIAKEAIEKHGGWWMVPDEEKTYWITLTIAEESLYHSMQGRNEAQTNSTATITRIDKQISLPLALLIQRVWGATLHNTRYPAKAHLGLDGTTYQFSVWVRNLGYLYGETWSPEHGLPRKLVDAGLSIITLVKAQPSTADAETKLIEQLSQIEKNIQKSEQSSAPYRSQPRDARLQTSGER